MKSNERQLFKVFSHSFPSKTTDSSWQGRGREKKGGWWTKGYFQIVAKISDMPRSEKSYILSEITYVGEVLDQTGDAGFLSSANISGMGWMPRTLSETTAEAKSPLNENRCLGPSTKSDLRAGKLHFTICPTVPDHGRGSRGSLKGDWGNACSMLLGRVYSNSQKENPMNSKPMNMCHQS